MQGTVRGSTRAADRYRLCHHATCARCPLGRHPRAPAHRSRDRLVPDLSSRAEQTARGVRVQDGDLRPVDRLRGHAGRNRERLQARATARPPRADRLRALHLRVRVLDHALTAAAPRVSAYCAPIGARSSASAACCLERRYGRLKGELVDAGADQWSDAE